MPSSVDLKFVREQFPALAGEEVYLDNGGGTQVLGEVVERLTKYLVDMNVQPVSSQVGRAARAADALHEARRQLAGWINAEDDEEIVLGASTTLLLRLLSDTIGKTLHPGDEIIVTDFDHEANIGPWERLQAQGITVRTLRSHAPDYRISLDELAALLTPATRLVCISHCSNIFGTINPIEEIAEIVHRAGALLCVDGVGFAPHREIDVRRWNVDFYVFSLYKTFGPHYALLYGRKKLLKRLPGIHHVFISEDAVPYKLQPGGTIYEFVYAAAAIPAYFEKLGRRLCASDAGAERRSAACRWVAEQEEALSERFLTFLNSRSDVLVIGSRRSDACIRVPIISFICGRDSRAVSEAVGRAGLTLRHGTFSAYRYCQQQKLDARGGVLRASFAHYNSLDDVDRLISALSPALSESS